MSAGRLRRRSSQGGWIELWCFTRPAADLARLTDKVTARVAEPTPAWDSFVAYREDFVFDLTAGGLHRNAVALLMPDKRPGDG